MTAVFRAPTRAHLYAALTQLLQLRSKQGCRLLRPSTHKREAGTSSAVDCATTARHASSCSGWTIRSAGPRRSTATRMPGNTSFATRAQVRSRIDRPCKWSIRSNGSPSKRHAAGARAFSRRDQQNHTSFGGMT